MTDDHIARVVADVDVLAADLYLDGSARAALDLIRSHSWISLIASERLINETTTLIEQLGSQALAEHWAAKIQQRTTIVEHPPRDHPALASAIRGNAAHLLSHDPKLSSAKTGVALQSHGHTSVKPPDAFVRLFDPQTAYEHITGTEYPGPDHPPRT